MDKLKTLDEMYAEHGIEKRPVKPYVAPVVGIGTAGIYLTKALWLKGFSDEEILRLSVIITEDNRFLEELRKRVNEI